MSTDDLLECHFNSLETRLNKELEGQSQAKVDEILQELDEWNDAVKTLEDGRKRLVARILAASLEKNEFLELLYYNKSYFWIHYINDSEQLRLLYRLRCRTFNMK